MTERHCTNEEVRNVGMGIFLFTKRRKRNGMKGWRRGGGGREKWRRKTLQRNEDDFGRGCTNFPKT